MLTSGSLRYGDQITRSFRRSEDRCVGRGNEVRSANSFCDISIDSRGSELMGSLVAGFKRDYG